MFKKLLIVLTVIIMIISLAGCGKTKTYEEATQQPLRNNFANGYFTEIYTWESNGLEEEYSFKYHIVYANDTKVKYLIIKKGHRLGITPLYNTDGSLQIYEGE